MIEDRTQELASLHQIVFGQIPETPPTPNTAGAGSSAEDADLINRARKAKNGEKFSRLWAGEWKGTYPSQSEADAALCCKLAFWTNKSYSRMDSLFRKSGLYREKWERDDYRHETLTRAISMTSDARDQNGSRRQQNSTENESSDTAARPRRIPSIKVSNRELRDMSQESLSALQKANKPPELFARGGWMVGVIRNESSRPLVREVTESALRGYMTKSANYYRLTKEKDSIAVPPPMEIVKDILALSPEKWNFPALEAITESPILRPDGSILDRPGYDHSTRLLYVPDPELTIPEIPVRPGIDHIGAALGIVEGIIGEFPFDDGGDSLEGCSKANAIACLLTPIVRFAIDKPTPVGVIDATSAGTGKTLLAEIVSLVPTGRAGEMLSAPRDSEEWRKQITPAQLNGAKVIIFDNLSHRLDSPELAKAVTEEIRSDRLLGTNKSILHRVVCSWIATGNNVQVGGDMARRCYWIRMDAKMATPFLRANFKHPNLKAHVLEHRGEILAALLTMARAWYVAGCPPPDVTPLGSFELWTTTIGGILQHAGIAGFLGNSAKVYEQADTDAEQWGYFLEQLFNAFRGLPFQISEVWAKLKETSQSGLSTASAASLRASLPDYLAEAYEKPGVFCRRAGNGFAARNGRRFTDAEFYIAKRRKLHKVQEWQVERGKETAGGYEISK